MKKLTLFLICILFAGMQFANAQTKSITGAVTSKDDGTSIPGVSVMVKGTTVGTVTNIDGKFELSVPADAKALVFSFIGMKNFEIEIGSQTSFNISMETDVFSVDEVVVVGYGVQQKRDVTGSISSVKGDDIKLMPVQSFDQALQGKAAGVQVTSRSENESAELSKQSSFPELSNPIPPGGSLKAFKRWVYDRLDYPAFKDYPGKHRITVVLTVRANGTISDIRIKEGPPEVIAADLKKIISQSTRWTAAHKDDNPVDADIEIHFVVTVE